MTDERLVMNPTRVLFLGGTGVISSACVALAVERGWDVTVLNRGTTSARPLAGRCGGGPRRRARPPRAVGSKPWPGRTSTRWPIS